METVIIAQTRVSLRRKEKNNHYQYYVKKVLSKFRKKYQEILQKVKYI